MERREIVNGTEQSVHKREQKGDTEKNLLNKAVEIYRGQREEMETV